MRVVERVEPVGASADNRRVSYRIADNFLAFWLGVVDRHQSAISAGPRRRCPRGHRGGLEVLLALGARERVEPEPSQVVSDHGPVIGATAYDIFG